MPLRPILTHDAAPSPQSSETPAPPVVVIAPNAFKGTLSPAEAANAMAVGVRRVIPEAQVVSAPVADGGDGSLDAFVAAGFEPSTVSARGPAGERARTRIVARGRVAVVELAGTCGMSRLDGGLAPMTSSTVGLGDAIRAALDTGATSLIVCLGGSASTDGGAGMLAALGARLLDEDGHEVEGSGAALSRIASVDLRGLDPRLAAVGVTVAVDVTAPLVGEAGAARLFAPQKGATPDEVQVLDAGLRRWAAALASATGHEVADLPGAGAAGGTAAALVAACGARLVSGADLVMDAIGLDGLIERADLVVTGEGRLDHQSALGKGAVAVARRCRGHGVPVLAVAGRITVGEADLRSAGFAAWSACSDVPAGDAEGEVAAATSLAVQRWRGRR